MEVIDFDGAHSAHSIAELEQLLGVRLKDQVNHFWLRADGSKFPELAISVKGDLSAIHYFPQRAACRVCVTRWEIKSRSRQDDHFFD